MSLRRVFIELTKSFWPAFAVVLTHGVLAFVFGHQRWLDPLLHFFGGVALMYSCHRLLTVFLGTRTWAISIGVALSIILIWELGEFLSDRILGTHVQHGTIDTVSDMV